MLEKQRNLKTSDIYDVIWANVEALIWGFNKLSVILGLGNHDDRPEWSFSVAFSFLFYFFHVGTAVYGNLLHIFVYRASINLLGTCIGRFGDFSYRITYSFSHAPKQKVLPVCNFCWSVSRGLTFVTVLTCIDVRHYFGLVFGTHHPAWQEEWLKWLWCYISHLSCNSHGNHSGNPPMSV